MTWLKYLDFSIYGALICLLFGFIPYVKSRRRLNLGRYTMLLFISVIGSMFLGFAVGFFGPLLVSSTQGQLIGIFLTGPIGAVLGLLIFWTYLLRLTKKNNSQVW